MIENKPKINYPYPLDKVIPADMIYPDMVKKTKRPAKVSFTPTETDFQIIQKGKEKHGANLSGIIRMALRRFAESEGMELKAS